MKIITPPTVEPIEIEKVGAAPKRKMPPTLNDILAAFHHASIKLNDGNPVSDQFVGKDRYKAMVEGASSPRATRAVAALSAADGGLRRFYEVTKGQLRGLLPVLGDSEPNPPRYLVGLKPVAHESRLQRVLQPQAQFERVAGELLKPVLEAGTEERIKALVLRREEHRKKLAAKGN